MSSLKQIEEKVALDQQELTENLVIEEFGRQLLVPGISEEGQNNLLKKNILLIGLGALGTISSQYLVRAGIGSITLLDFDKVSLSNLHRQINYNKKDINKYKSEISKQVLSDINSVTKIIQHPISFELFLKKNNMDNIDLIFDCSDSYKTKINSSLFAKAKSIAYSSTSINSSEGIFFSQNYFKENDSYCFRCLFPNVDETNHRCLNSAMIGPVAGFVASLACSKIILELAKNKPLMKNEILLIDLLTSDINKLELNQSNCNHTYE